MEMDTGIDIKELKCFASVVENKSFSRAAVQLNLTQPTVSNHISKLERKLGVCLIVRTSKESYASDAGKVYYRYIKDILRLRQKVIALVSRYSMDTWKYYITREKIVSDIFSRLQYCVNHFEVTNVSANHDLIELITEDIEDSAGL